jgi:uncharacterized membrane protein YgcG
MPVQPTYDDVNLILKLYELRREERMRKARAWFAKYKASSIDEHLKHYPPGSEEDASFRMVTTYWEMVASFVTAGRAEPGTVPGERRRASVRLGEDTRDGPKLAVDFEKSDDDGQPGKGGTGRDREDESGESGSLRAVFGAHKGYGSVGGRGGSDWRRYGNRAEMTI